MAPSIWLITGASRGIGKAFTSILLQESDTTVIAAIRNPAKYAQVLESLPKASGSKLIIVKIDSLVDTDPVAAVAELRDKHGIEHLDVVIANAGGSGARTSVADIPAAAFRETFELNTLAPILLFHETKPLLKASKGKPVFTILTSKVGTLAAQELVSKFPAKFAPYGAAKAAVNWLCARLHYEEPWLVTMALGPSIVDTDLARETMPNVDLKAVGAISPEKSCSGMIKVIREGTRETIGGKVVQYDGQILPY